MNENQPIQFGSNPRELADRLAALAESPPVLVALEQKAARARDQHLAVIARLRAAEKEFVDAELAHAGKGKDAQAEIERATAAYHKARAVAEAKLDESNTRFRAAANEVRVALAAIDALPRWKLFDEWREKVENVITYSFVEQSTEPPRPVITLSDRDPGAKIYAWERARGEVNEARQASADAVLLAFRSTLNTARTIFASEAEALAACREALQSVKREFTLPSDRSWPT